MKYTLEDIDAYFSGNLTDVDKKDFEEMLHSNIELAEQVAFYLQAKEAAKQLSQQERKAEFEQLRQQLQTTKTTNLWPLASALAAACVILAGVWMFVFNQPNASEMAQNYIQNDLAQISVNMGADVDSLQLASTLYNDKKYNEALVIFKKLNAHSDNEAVFKLEYTGLTQLQLGQYDAAIASFQQLAQNKAITNNKGKFYEALTLMKQDLPKQKTQVITLLEEVVNNDLGNKQQAEEWLKKLK